MSAMLRGPTVTVLSQTRCQEMRGKRRIKLFIVIAQAEVKDREQDHQPEHMTTSIVNYKNPTELCKCAQLKRTLTALGRRVAAVMPRSMLLGRDLSGNRNCRNNSNSRGLLRDRTIFRFIYYAKVTILTELLSFLRGIRFSISPI